MTGEFHYMVRSVNDAPRGTRERHGLWSLDLSQPRVSFFCQEASHESDPWFAASFCRRPQTGGEPRWELSPYYPTDDGHGFWIGYGARASLSGDRAFDAERDPDSVYADDLRFRYGLRCGLCGLNRSRRHNELANDLERLWTAGLYEVSVRAYAAML